MEPNFNDFLKSPIGESKHFTWSEALYLHDWQVHVVPEYPDVMQAIKIQALKMDEIRNFLNRPITIDSWYRPIVYNESISGAKRSAHLFGMACDFTVKGLAPNEVRAALAPRLVEFNIRMENLPDSNWVHVDANCTKNMPIENRYFIPKR